MPATREMLEGEAYWGHVRSLKLRIYLIEVILIIVLGALIIAFAGDYQTSPFFIAIDLLLIFVLIMLFMIMIEGIIFRILQIRIAKSDSKKHIMTINSMKRALIILIVAAIVAILFVFPGTVNAMEDSLSNRGSLDAAEFTHQFLSGDPMGLSYIRSISLNSEIGATVYLVSQANYDLYGANIPSLAAVAMNLGNDFVDPDLEVSVENRGYMYLWLVFDAVNSPNGGQVDFVLHRAFGDTLNSHLPLMMLLFAGANGAWIAYLWPLRKKYAVGSIYK